MCGISGSGKSTIAKEYAKQNNAEIVSTDEIRKELFGDASIQENGYKVFCIARDRIIEKLKRKENVIFDATNLRMRDRKKVLGWVKDFNCEKLCFAVIVPYETAVARNLNRKERIVSKEVILKQKENYIIPTKNEGWNRIYFFDEREKKI